MSALVAESVVEALSGAVNPDRLVQTATELVSIPSATGNEQACAEYMAEQLAGVGMTVTQQQVESGRLNVIGTLRGSKGAHSLMLAGHLDTSYSGNEPWANKPGFRPSATLRDGRIYGLGISNMKGALAAYLEAMHALHDAGVTLRGDILVAGVCGEIEKAQWGDYQGAEYRGYGIGSRALPIYGVLPDWCILGEATERKLVLGHFGSMWTRLSVSGPFVHTAWSSPTAEDNSIVRMHQIMPVVREWIDDWTGRATEGTTRSVVNISAIRGGYPWRLSRTPARTDLFLDIRVPPSLPMQSARTCVNELVDNLRRRFPEHGVESEIYLAAPGTLLDPSNPVVEAVDAAHQSVFGDKAKREVVRWFCDASAYAASGIATIIYGASSGLPGSEGESLEVAELTSFAKAYLLAAASLCEVEA